MQHAANAVVTTGDGVVTCWGVAEVKSIYQILLQLRAAPHEAPTNVGGDIVVTAVKDPRGNPFGIIYNPHFTLP